MKDLTWYHVAGALTGVTLLTAAFYTQFALLPATWLALSSVGFLLMGIDKAAAQNQQVRVPERVFLTLSAIGAGAGILVGAALFRHKIRKKYFFTVIVICTALHLLLIKSLFVQ